MKLTITLAYAIAATNAVKILSEQAVFSPTPTTAHRFVEHGCFKDTGVRALPTLWKRPSEWVGGTEISTEEKQQQCAQAAVDAGLTYFALQYPQGGTHCFASNDYDLAISYGATECGLEGDAWENYVYELAPVHQYREVGCFKDTGVRALPTLWKRPSEWVGGTEISTEEKQAQCAQFAVDAGLTYFALQYPQGGTHCFASNDYDLAISYGATECGLEGDAWENYVYELANPAQQFNNIGCFNDRSTRALPDQLFTPGAWVGGSSITTEEKQAQCHWAAVDAGLNVFGLQWPQGGTECWAGNDRDLAYSYGATECGLEGDGWKNQVYETINKPIVEIGCFKDTGVRALPTLWKGPEEWVGGSSISTEEKQKQCAQFAVDAGLAYFALQYPQGGTHCFASNDYDLAISYGATECGLEGDAWMNYVYKVVDSRAFA